MRLYLSVANMVTGCNLLCGCLSVVFSARERLDYAFLFILLGAVFDFFDGWCARKLNEAGSIGIELDSLADDITFGLAPTLMLFFFLFPSMGWITSLCLPMAVFSALRLAIFNTDTEQKYQFKGLATPANAMFWGGLIAYMTVQNITIGLMPILFLIALSWVSCFLLIAPLPLFSLKFTNKSWKNNTFRYIFLIGSVGLFLLFGIVALLYSQWSLCYLCASIIIVWYLLCNAVSYLIIKQR